MEQQESRQAGRDQGITLGEGLGRIAHRVQPVGDPADVIARSGHLVNAVGVIGDGPEGVFGEDIRAGHQHAHGGYGRAENAAAWDAGAVAEKIGDQQRQADGRGGHQGGFETDRRAGDDVGGRAGERGGNDGFNRPEAVLGVILGGVNDHDAGHDAHHAGTEEQPAVQHDQDGQQQAGNAEADGHEVTPVEGGHGVFVILGVDREDADHARQQAEGTHDERKEDPVDVFGGGVNDRRQDHGANALGGGGFEEVGASAGAVAYIIAHQVGDHGGVARVVLGEACLDLAHQVSAHVGGLGVDPAAQLSKEATKLAPKPNPTMSWGARSG